jgi:hypothetical protein
MVNLMHAFLYTKEEIPEGEVGWPLICQDVFVYNLDTLHPQPAPVVAGWIAKYPASEIIFRRYIS